MGGVGATQSHFPEAPYNRFKQLQGQQSALLRFIKLNASARLNTLADALLAPAHTKDIRQLRTAMARRNGGSPGW